MIAHLADTIGPDTAINLLVGAGIGVFIIGVLLAVLALRQNSTINALHAELDAYRPKPPRRQPNPAMAQTQRLPVQRHRTHDRSAT